MSQGEAGVEEEALVAEPAEEEPAPVLEEVGEEEVWEDVCEDWLELEELMHQSSFALMPISKAPTWLNEQTGSSG